MDGQAAKLLLVLLVTWASLPIFAGSVALEASSLHPVVLLPGYGCSQLDARLTGEFDPASTAPSCGGGVLKGKKKGWFRLWNNRTALQEDPALVPCYAELLRLVYDTAAGDYRNVPGVETRVVAFGTTRGFGSDDPASKNGCMGKLVQALEAVGYREGENLFGAPYDFRYAPAPPGQANRKFSRFLSSLTALVEHASEKNGGTPVILVTHSLGGINADAFLRRRPLAWRRRYVKHFVMASTGAGGGVFLLRFGSSSSPPTDPLSFGRSPTPPGASRPRSPPCRRPRFSATRRWWSRVPGTTPPTTSRSISGPTASPATRWRATSTGCCR